MLARTIRTHWHKLVIRQGTLGSVIPLWSPGKRGMQMWGTPVASAGETTMKRPSPGCL